MNVNIGFIGAGNMGSALINGILGKGLVAPSEIHVHDIDREKTDELAERQGVSVCKDRKELVERSEIIILAVKPKAVPDALKGIEGLLDTSRFLVSIAAGISMAYIKKMVGNRCKVVRAMPNTPALVGEGMTVLSLEKGSNEDDYKDVKNIFEAVGRVEILDESLMNEVIAVSGSSPAYVFILIEAMADAAVRSGIARGTAYRLAAQSVMGAAKMVLDTEKHPAVLKDMVCSPAGTTVEAVASLEKNGFRSSIIEAMNRCTIKAAELGK